MSDNDKMISHQTVEGFLRADFIIPSHGGSMVPGFSGTPKDAQRIIDRLTNPHRSQA